jgi:hypothetical protein
MILPAMSSSNFYGETTSGPEHVFEFAPTEQNQALCNNKVDAIIFATPTAPPISHWPAGCSAYPTRHRQAGTATAPKIVTKTASGTLVLAAAGV